MTFKSPICPACGKPLDVVWECSHDTYRFNPETGRYTEEVGDLEISCGNCEADVADLLPEGACNYDAKNPPEPEEEVSQVE